MARYRLLPKALEHIAAIVASLGIQPIDPAHTPARAARQGTRCYMTPVRWRNRVVWFKASLQDAPGLAHGLEDEITIQRAFADYERGRTMAFDSPSFLQAGRRGPVRWLLRRYWNGWYAGDMAEAFGFSPRFVRNIEPARMARVMADVRRMTPFMRRRLRLTKHDAGWYQLDWHFYRRHFLKPLLTNRLNPGWSQKTISQIDQILKQSSPWLRRETTWFTHGDFYPNNLMVTGQRRQQVVLFDWELAHLNVAPFDSVMAWLMAWRHPAWQAKFHRAVRRDLPAGAPTERAWAIASLSLGLRLAGFAYIRLTNSQPERYSPLPPKHRQTIRTMFDRMIPVVKQALVILGTSGRK